MRQIIWYCCLLPLQCNSYKYTLYTSSLMVFIFILLLFMVKKEIFSFLFNSVLFLCSVLCTFILFLFFCWMTSVLKTKSYIHQNEKQLRTAKTLEFSSILIFNFFVFFAFFLVFKKSNWKSSEQAKNKGRKYENKNHAPNKLT